MNLDPLIIVSCMSCVGQNHLRISILDLQKRIIFPLECLQAGDIITYLNIKLLVSTYGNKVNFFLVQFSNIDLITSAHQFNADDVLIHPTIVKVSPTQYGEADTGIAQIVFHGRFQVLLSANIVSAYVIEDKGVAKVKFPQSCSKKLKVGKQVTIEASYGGVTVSMKAKIMK